MTRNDIIMTSLPKTIENADLCESKHIIYHSKGIDESYPKMYFFIEFEPLCQKLWVFMSNFGIFTMPTPQLWPCHVNQEANFEKLLFYSAFNIRKSYKISGRKALYFRSYQPKTSRPPPPPSPVLLGLSNPLTVTLMFF